ncbi:cupin domain-containing protein [Streptomyces sp. NPDC002574]|uniref:cupin domain-containing protein n=1 Tax=Streptomyces sp. NPDC002574 TaxID=3364652 RepID=UPI00368F67D3
MSYPKQVYFGDGGEINAHFLPTGTAPDTGGTGNTMAIRYLATSQLTRGEFGLYRVTMKAGTDGPKTHFHRTISESFFILDGTMSLFNGDKWIDARQGDFLHVPQGGLHAFRNDSDAAAEMLLLFTPGAPREEFFEKVSEMGNATEEERAEFYGRHDQYFAD